MASFVQYLAICPSSLQLKQLDLSMEMNILNWVSLFMTVNGSEIFVASFKLIYICPLKLKMFEKSDP